MKKILLFIATIIVVTSASAQHRKPLTGRASSASQTDGKLSFQHPSQLLQQPLQMKAGSMNVTAIYTQDFSGGTLPANWDTIDNSGSGFNWAYGFGPLNDYTSDTLLSPTYANGLMIADDDGFGTPISFRDADLITESINCAAYNKVHISFYEFFRQYSTGLGTLSVSNDGGATWYPVYMIFNTTPNPKLADIDVSTYAANQANVKFKFNYSGSFDYWWQIDDISVFVPANVDGAVDGLIVSASDCQLTATEPVTIVIRNVGQNIINTCTAVYSVNGNSITTPETVTFPSGLAPNDTAYYTFNAKADLSVDGPYEIQGWVNVATDADAANDSSAIYFRTKYPVYTVNGTSSMSMGFEIADEISGWFPVDANQDGVTWGYSIITPHAGTYDLRVAPATGSPDMDDWIITTCFDFQSGTTYTLQYWMRMFASAGANSKIKTFWGTDGNPDSLTHAISTTTGVASTYVKGTGNFTVPTTGIYYLGFEAVAAATPGITYLDDIGVAVSTGVNTIDTESKWFDVYPNPASSRLTISMNRPFVKASVEVINILGSVVKSFTAEASSRTIDVANLESGIYTVKVTLDGKDVFKRFVISR